jgi:exodeoxyribonuclease VII small subunit
MAEQSFEKALAELEEIVAKMEKGGLPLNDSLTLFEKGVKLARFLRGELEKAEKKIEILLKDEQGKVKTGPFALTPEEGPAEEPDEEESSEEGGDNDLPF